MRAVMTSFGAGLLFGIGLLVSGMADAANVLGFLDVAGDWNPSLALVMAGGLGVCMAGYWLCRRQDAPLYAHRFQWPEAAAIDARLVGGAALFGLGWGIAGYCPGPAVVATASGLGEAAIFTLAMVAGMVAWKVIAARAAVCPIAARLRRGSRS